MYHRSGFTSGMSPIRTTAKYAFGRNQTSRACRISCRSLARPSNRPTTVPTNKTHTANPMPNGVLGQRAYNLTSRPPRYPNYLPEMRARRAVLARRTLGSPGPSPTATQGLLEEVQEAILRDLLKLTDSRIPLPLMLPRKSQATAGHPLINPPPIVTQHYPKIVLSLYRSPANIVRDWEVGSPTVALRYGESLGPTPNDQPTPESHSTYLSIRGRNRSHDIRTAIARMHTGRPRTRATQKSLQN